MKTNRLYPQRHRHRKTYINFYLNAYCSSSSLGLTCFNHLQFLTNVLLAWVFFKSNILKCVDFTGPQVYHLQEEIIKSFMVQIQETWYSRFAIQHEIFVCGSGECGPSYCCAHMVAHQINLQYHWEITSSCFGLSHREIFLPRLYIM